MRKELADTGVKVTCIQPGDVTTEISNNDTDQEVCMYNDDIQAVSINNCTLVGQCLG